MAAKDSPCVVPDCPAWRRAVGCGFLTAGAPCGHPRYRERWLAAQAAQGPETQPASVIRRAEAAQRPLSPARALQLALQLEVTDEHWIGHRL
jgi:hypothetical protein